MSAKPDGDGPASRSDELRPFDFLEYLKHVKAASAAVFTSASSRTIAEKLALILQLLDAVFDNGLPLTDDLRHRRDDLRRYLETVDAVLSGRASPLPDPPSRLPAPPSLYDPFVSQFLRLNYEHAVKTAGREAANAELWAIVKGLTAGRRGRPAEIPVRQVQEAKRLYDAGQGFSQIAKTLGLGSARRIRTALLHHFPGMKPPKKTPR